MMIRSKECILPRYCLHQFESRPQVGPLLQAQRQDCSTARSNLQLLRTSIGQHRTEYRGCRENGAQVANQGPQKNICFRRKI